MSADGQRTKCCRNMAENFNSLSKAHERYRQTQTADRPMTYSEHELEFTFAKKTCVMRSVQFERKCIRQQLRWLTVVDSSLCHSTCTSTHSTTSQPAIYFTYMYVLSLPFPSFPFFPPPFPLATKQHPQI